MIKLLGSSPDAALNTKPSSLFSVRRFNVVPALSFNDVFEHLKGRIKTIGRPIFSLTYTAVETVAYYLVSGIGSPIFVITLVLNFDDITYFIYFTNDFICNQHFIADVLPLDI